MGWASALTTGSTVAILTIYIYTSFVSIHCSKTVIEKVEVVTVESIARSDYVTKLNN